MKPLDERVAYDAEVGLVGLADGLLGLRLDGERIDGLAILVYAEVEVRPSGEAGGAHVSDNLLLCHMVAYLEALGKAGEVHVGGGVGAVVAYLDVIAATIGLVTLGYDLAATDGIHGSARRGCIVHAMMSTIALEYGVIAAIGEARRDAVIVEWGLQEGSFEAVSLFIVIELLAVLDKGNGVVHAVGSTEGCCTYAEVVQRALLHVFLLVDEGEMVSFLYAEEVDGPPEDVGKLDGKLGRGASIEHGVPQR